VPNFVATDETVACRDIVLFSKWRPSAIVGLLYVTSVWTTHEEYLVVFVTVQNLFGIDAVISIVYKF